jgi:Ca2+-binding RTX toxin-like protein
MTGEDPGAFTDQEALYEAAGILLGSISANSDAPNELIDLTEYSAQTLMNVAGQDDAQGRACRYALANLQPFVLLQTNSDQPVYDALDEAYDLDQFTEQYLQDRALFLNTLNTFYVTDASVIGDNDDKLIEFKDEASGEFVTLQKADDSVSQRFFFGDNEVDSYTGGTDDDHLYGGAGDDALHGEAGIDHLYGGTERDLLIGGTGADTLIGGNDHDFLIGGHHIYDEVSGYLHIFDDGEVDRLEGGEGDDLYWAGLVTAHTTNALCMDS